MYSFEDQLGKRWDVEVTVPLVRQIAMATKHDDAIGRAVNLGEPSASRFIEDVLADRVVMAVVIWHLCGKQAREASITEDDFYRRVASSIDDAREALVGAMAVFMKSPEESTIFRDSVAAAIRASGSQNASDGATLAALATVATEKTPQQVQDEALKRLRQMEAAREVIFDRMTSTSSLASATGSQLSPVSTLTPPTPTENSSDSPSNDNAPSGTAGVY